MSAWHPRVLDVLQGSNMSDRQKKIDNCRDVLKLALEGSNLAALRAILRRLSAFLLSRDELEPVLGFLRKTSFAGAAWPSNYNLVDELYEWVLCVNLEHGWTLEVAEQRLPMNVWIVHGCRGKK